MKAASILTPCLIAVIAVALGGCTPTFDWREVRHDSAGWAAVFPGKPVEVTRTLTLKESGNTITFSLKSARIDDVMFAVGWAANANKAVQEQLESAMLTNIGASADQIHKTATVIDSKPAIEIEATGRIQIAANEPPREAKLLMRSVLVKDRNNSPVIEIIVVGPADRYSVQAAQQFVESLQIY